MMLRFIAAIISSWLCLSSIGFATEPSGVLQSNRLEYDAEFRLISLKGQSLVIYGDYTLQADKIDWDLEQKHLRANGHVLLYTPEVKIQAKSLSLNIDDLYIQAEFARIDYRSILQLEAQSVFMTTHYIRAKQALLTSSRLPFRLEAEQVKFFYRVLQNNLQLEQVSLNSSLIKLPILNLTLPSEFTPDLPLEVRNQNDILNPRFQLSDQHVLVGVQTRLLNDQFQRLFLQGDYHTQFGFQTGLIYEWRPLSNWLFLSNFRTSTFNPFQYQARQDIYYSFFTGDMVQLSLRAQELSLFRTLLPVQLQVFDSIIPFSSELQWISPAYSLQHFGHIQSIAGVGYHGESSLTAGGVLNYSSPNWVLSPVNRLRVLGEGAYLNHDLKSVLTVGSRIQFEQDWWSHLTQGLYGEKYFAYSPELSFSNDDRLLWRLGSYIIWQINREIHLGLSAEFSPAPFKLTGMDSMLTIRQKPVITNLLFTLIPMGLQTRVDFEF